jgi:hypothetical protein
MGFLSDVADFVSPITDLISPGVGSLLSGGVGMLGGMMTNQANQDIAAANSAFNADQAKLNREFQAQQVKEAQDYQTQMSNTSYQRSVRDMQAAGLNPMLAYMKGGASTPSISPASGSTAQAQGAVMQNPALAFSSGVRDFASASQANSTVAQIEANTDKIREEIKNVPETGKQIRFTVQLLAEQAALAAQKGETEVSIRKMQAATIENLKKDGTLKQLDISAAESLDNLGRESRQLKPIVDMLRMILK